jgi:hypothetical protein
VPRCSSNSERLKAFGGRVDTQCVLGATSPIAIHLPWWTWVLLVVAGVGSALEAERKRERKAAHRRYLKSAAWKQKRRAALDRAGHRCQDCGRRAHGLHVHHLTYKRWGREEARDLRVLCSKCHGRRHGPNRGLIDELTDSFFD